MVDIRNYAFIDGNYLRRAYEDTMRKWFPAAAVADIDFVNVRAVLNASKVFFYDSVDENAADAQNRKDFLDAINALDGFHVRQGTISGKKKRQKKVDVQLAVDMLIHAFNKNIWHASLVAGDLDFQPLVDALIHLGIHVHVLYEHKSGAKPLYRSADVGTDLNIRTFWDWSTTQFQKHNRAPHSEKFATPLTANINRIVKNGTWNGRPVVVHETHPPVEYVFMVQPDKGGDEIILRYPDIDRLLKYFEISYGGSIAWN